MKALGRKGLLTALWGVAMIGVLALLLGFGVKGDLVIGAWLAAFVALPTQFGIANAVITRKAIASGVTSGVTSGVE